jgi:hypothetical protein
VLDAVNDALAPFASRSMKFRQHRAPASRKIRQSAIINQKGRMGPITHYRPLMTDF